MRFLTRLAARLAGAQHCRADCSVRAEQRGFLERCRGPVPHIARSPIQDDLARRPGQVSWLVARAVTLQYR